MSRAANLVAAARVLALAACVIGTLQTVSFVVNSGLMAPRPPLGGLQTMVRVAGLVTAVALVAVRRDRLERVTLVVAIVAMGSSALFGFGLRSPVLSAVRLLFHLAGYALGTIVFLGLLLADKRTPARD